MMNEFPERGKELEANQLNEQVRIRVKTALESS